MAAAARRLRGSSVADSRLSVKNLIESIENATKHHKAGGDCSAGRGLMRLFTLGVVKFQFL